MHLSIFMIIGAYLSVLALTALGFVVGVVAKPRRKWRAASRPAG